jgi:hypothetical protein
MEDTAAISIRGLAKQLDQPATTLRRWGITTEMLTHPREIVIAVKAAPDHFTTIPALYEFLIQSPITTNTWLITVGEAHYLAQSAVDAMSIAQHATSTVHMSPIGKW